jgi:hypothetical protein
LTAALDQRAENIPFCGAEDALKLEVEVQARHLQGLGKKKFGLELGRRHALLFEEVGGRVKNVKKAHGRKAKC